MCAGICRRARILAGLAFCVALISALLEAPVGAAAGGKPDVVAEEVDLPLVHTERFHRRSGRWRRLRGVAHWGVCWLCMRGPRVVGELLVTSVLLWVSPGANGSLALVTLLCLAGLREVVYLVGWFTRASGWQLAAGILGRVVRFAWTVAAMQAAASQTYVQVVGVVAGQVMAANKPSIEVRDKVMTAGLGGGIVLRIPLVLEEVDERLAMLVVRMLLREESGRPVFTHEAIAMAFGKKDRRNCQNHEQQFRARGGSLGRLVLEGRRGRPSLVHPEVQDALAAYWAQCPLATDEETIDWLKERRWLGDVPLPSPEELKRETRIDGNLLAVRSTLRRMLARSNNDRGYAVRRDVTLRALFDLVDRQDAMLLEAGVTPPARPGLLGTGDSEAPMSVRPSRTVSKLADGFRTLCRNVMPFEDENAASSLAGGWVDCIHHALLYCSFRLSIRQVADIVGRSKSTVYRRLVAVAAALEEVDPFPAALHFSGCLGLDEKWVAIPKSFSKQQQHDGKKWRFVFFAVDALTGDLLHVAVFDQVTGETVRVFLRQVRARGIRPKAVVTDMLSSYHEAIGEVFGNHVLHHYCLFHHLQAVHRWMTSNVGNDWRRHADLVRLVSAIDTIYRCKDRRTARRRLDEVLAVKDAATLSHPEVEPLFSLLEARFPLVANAVGSKSLPATNNITERVIKAFHRHYRDMAGLESLETAEIQAKLFRFWYRLTPMRDAVEENDRNKCPLEKAGFHLGGMPMAQYVRQALADVKTGRRTHTALGAPSSRLPGADVLPLAAVG